MKYAIRHSTTYSYSTPVLVSHHAARLKPRETAWQRCQSHELTVEPAPATLSGNTDYFGNPVAFFILQQPHRVLTVTARSVVEVTPPPLPDAAATPPWEQVRDALLSPKAEAELEAVEFLYETPHVGWTDEAIAFACASFPPGRPVLEGVLDLTRRIHQEFAYRPGMTAVGTSVADILAARGGVCQDFAHLELACLRGLGLAARYVSGYLMTRPPPGREKLVGSDASHAWVSVWVPGSGWVDVDPTNDLMVGDEHITCAWGRDYDDVSPIKGIVFGGGDHSLRVSVDVAPEG